jgi:hypothetical protein
MKNLLSRLWVWFLGPSYIRDDPDGGVPQVGYDGVRGSKLVREEPDEFGLVASDYERAGIFSPKHTQKALLSWTREDGKLANTFVYDHEIQPVLDFLNEARSKERGLSK